MFSPEVERFLAALSRLRRDKAVGPEKPYKPIMLAAVVLLIGKGKIESPDVLLDGALKSACRQLLAILYPTWPYPFDPRYPFRALENDDIWHLEPHDADGAMLSRARGIGAKTRELLKHVSCARMPTDVFEALACSAEFRSLVLSELAARYFPASARAVLSEFESGAVFGAARRSISEVVTERMLEENLEQAWGESSFGKLGVELEPTERSGRFGRQVFTKVNCIDMLGQRSSQREWWVIELKRGRPADAVVGQISRYIGWIKAERAVEGDAVVGAIVARGADEKLKYAVASRPDLTLWMWDDDFDVVRVH